MLRDQKSERFIENFAGQWLGLRDINFTEPDARLYPEFDEMLRFAQNSQEEFYKLNIFDFIIRADIVYRARLASGETF